MYSLIFLWVWEDLPLQLKRPAREADHLPPSSANVKKDCSPTSTLPIRLHVVRKDKFGFKFLRCDAGCERVPDDPNFDLSFCDVTLGVSEFPTIQIWI